MGRIRDLIKALSTNEYVIEDNEYENIQAELKELERSNPDTQKSVAELERRLENNQKREKLKEELQSVPKEEVKKAVRKAKHKEEQEIEER